VSDSLSANCLENAVTVELSFEPNETPISTQILTAEYIIATALNVGRPKDLLRISQFIEAKSFDMDLLCEILKENDLVDKWSNFCDKFNFEIKCSFRKAP
jgi:hypothetical protein